MNQLILTVHISAANLVMLRGRTRQVGELFGLDKLACTRFATAVSEIARNTVQYAGEGTASFLFDGGGPAGQGQQVIAMLSDRGPGIDDLQAVLAGRLNARGQVPLGISGSKRLADNLGIECPAGGGTQVTLAMALPRHASKLSGHDIQAVIARLAADQGRTPLEELEKVNREMLYTLDQLRLRQQELLEADERKNQFLATLAHELRNPLGTLQMTLGLIERMAPIQPEELVRRCAVMARQTRQLATLVDDLMDVSRVTHGKVELSREPAEFNALVSQAVEMSSAATEERAHTVALVPHASPLWIHGDASRLKQVLCNLIQDAARYTPEGGLITVSVRREDSNAVVVVADNGVGIAAQALPHVFEMFVQGQASGSVSKAGLGVGLTLVQRLTHDHGGTVAAASAGLGQGSQFTVTLPLIEAPAGTS